MNTSDPVLPTLSNRYVDMWALSSMHPTNIDLLQRLKSADDRQFGTNMDVCGLVSELNPKTSAWEKTHLIGIRNDVWNPDTQEREKILQSLQKDRREQLRQQIKKSGRLNTEEKTKLDQQLSTDPVMAMNAANLENRRLVLKMFKTTGERIRWIGTIEEITSREVHQSLGSHRALLSMAVMLADYKYVITVPQMHRTLRWPAIFTFALYEENQRRMRYITIQQDWIAIGTDFTIISGGHKIGKIDGKLLGLGYNANIIIDDPELQKNRQFIDLLTIFTSSVGYHQAMRKSIKRRMQAALSGAVIPHVIEREELWLLKNPRARE